LTYAQSYYAILRKKMYLFYLTKIILLKLILKKEAALEALARKENVNN